MTVGIKDALIINLVFENDRNVFVFKDRTLSTKSLQSEVYTAFDLLFLLDRIHGDALTEVDVMIDFLISLLSMVVGSFRSPAKAKSEASLYML